MSPAAKSLFTADFRRGEFAKPFRVHAGVVPGAAVMTARRAAIRYEVFDQALEAHGTLPEAHRVREVTRLTMNLSLVRPQLSVKRRTPSSPALRSGFAFPLLSGRVRPVAGDALEVPLSLLYALSW